MKKVFICAIMVVPGEFAFSLKWRPEQKHIGDNGYMVSKAYLRAGILKYNLRLPPRIARRRMCDNGSSGFYMKTLTSVLFSKLVFFLKKYIFYLLFFQINSIIY